MKPGLGDIRRRVDAAPQSQVRRLAVVAKGNASIPSMGALSQTPAAEGYSVGTMVRGITDKFTCGGREKIRIEQT
jgi:hypothetical protein